MQLLHNAPDDVKDIIILISFDEVENKAGGKNVLGVSDSSSNKWQKPANHYTIVLMRTIRQARNEA